MKKVRSVQRSDNNKQDKEISTTINNVTEMYTGFVFNRLLLAHIVLVLVLVILLVRM